MSQSQGQGQQVQIKATDEKLAGSYANMMQVSHTKEEFVLDFVNILPPAGQLVSRILISPAHAKRVMMALQENIQRYESQFTKIEGVDVSKPSFGFKTE
ncbi:MAG TPA: DUF3467 domain-containing protein [Candidatus Doudnabacteria bacterium]|nr:DUF3467 domain-containing protein [Candidatus Doudnabacteria bacterium]